MRSLHPLEKITLHSGIHIVHAIKEEKALLLNSPSLDTRSPGNDAFLSQGKGDAERSG
jgi:hypothetical protein